MATKTKGTVRQYEVLFEKFYVWGRKVQQDLTNLERYMLKLDKRLYSPLPQFKKGKASRKLKPLRKRKPAARP